ncbi:MAG: transcriptional regulator [Thermogutta sp.]
MAQPHSIRPEDVPTIPPELQELAGAVQSLPAPYRAQVDPLLQRVIEGTRRRRQILSLVQDALSELRMDMKYLLFDLEATRRERDDYRRQLEQLRQGE